MSLVYNQMLVKKQAMDKLEQQGRNKHEYDSDEDTEVRYQTGSHPVFFYYIQVILFSFLVLAFLGRYVGAQGPKA